MVKYGSDKVGFILIDGFNVLGVETEITETKEALLEESHALGDSWVEQTYVGVKKVVLDQSGFFDDAANSINDALVTSIGVSRIVCYGYEGNTNGKAFVGFQGAMEQNYQRMASRDALHKANAHYEGNGQVDEGKILHLLQAETTDPGNTTAVDNTASTSAGGQGYLHVTALTLGGFTSLDVKIQDSADNVTFATEVDFANVTTVPAKESLSSSGTVNRYLRVSWDFIGAGAGQSATFFAGFSRG